MWTIESSLRHNKRGREVERERWMGEGCTSACWSCHQLTRVEEFPCNVFDEHEFYSSASSKVEMFFFFFKNDKSSRRSVKCCRVGIWSDMYFLWAEHRRSNRVLCTPLREDLWLKDLINNLQKLAHDVYILREDEKDVGATDESIYIYIFKPMGKMVTWARLSWKTGIETVVWAFWKEACIHPLNEQLQFSIIIFSHRKCTPFTKSVKQGAYWFWTWKKADYNL